MIKTTIENDKNSKAAMEPITLMPIGVVKSEIKEITFQPDADVEPEIRKAQTREFRRKHRNTISEVIVFDEFQDALDGIEGFSHVLILFWPHLRYEDRDKLRKVHPMGRKDIPLQGIFATRSPVRPNPVLVSSVQLLERKENILRVKGLDAIDGSPVIDIKPVTRVNDGVTDPTFPAWINQLHEELES